MRLVVLMLAVALGWAKLAWSQGIIVPCGDPLGAWTWQLGGTVRFADEDTVTWSSTAEGSAGFGGTWVCDLTDGAIVVEWQHGFTATTSIYQDSGRCAALDDRLRAAEQPQSAATIGSPQLLLAVDRARPVDCGQHRGHQLLRRQPRRRNRHPQRTGGGVNIDGALGNRLEGDLSGYVAAYNAQWEAAVAGLRRLLAQPRSSSPSFSTSGDDGSSSSSSYDRDDDDSSSGSDYGTAAQNSWGAGDMAAYGRIESGTPTGDDCYRYGC